MCEIKFTARTCQVHDLQSFDIVISYLYRAKTESSRTLHRLEEKRKLRFAICRLCYHLCLGNEACHSEGAMDDEGWGVLQPRWDLVGCQKPYLSECGTINMDATWEATRSGESRVPCI